MLKDAEEFKAKIGRVLISEEEIKEKISQTAERISRDYYQKPLLIVSVLNGAFVFLADLCRQITIPCEIAFMKAKSYYDGTDSAGEVEITLDVMRDISEYNIIIAEDIIDTGRTLSLIVKELKSRDPLSLSVITLLDKPQRRVVDFKADLSLFTIPDRFVVGYGLDCGEYFRNLPYIAELNL